MIRRRPAQDEDEPFFFNPHVIYAQRNELAAPQRRRKTQEYEPLERRSHLVEANLALTILSLTEGTIGEIAALLIRRAALYAIERDTEQITLAALQHCGYIAPSNRRRAAVSN